MGDTINLIAGFYVFIISLVVGSFLNVVIYRIPENMSLAHPSSHCPKCNYKLAWYDLIPVLSYLALRGKCRKCKTKISIRYPLVELSTAIMAWLIFWANGLAITTAAYVILLYFLIVVAMIDFDRMEVYPLITRLGAIIGIAYLIHSVMLSKNYLVLAGVLVAPIVIWLLSKLAGGTVVGDGDAEIMLLVSAYLGLKLSILTLFIAFIIGGAVAAFLILKFKKSRKHAIPFGPFIALGSIISMICGTSIIHYYMSLMGI